MTRKELEVRWGAQRDAFNRAGALVEGAKIVDQFLTDFSSVDCSETNTVVTLKKAAAWSGYSIEHLGRLIRHGAIANAGRKGAPRVRLADLPRRQFAKTRSGSYSVDADARALRNGRQ